MKKLEIELFRYETLVFGKVLYQDESLRNMETIVEKDAFSIGSWIYPDLTKEKLFIRGNDKKTDNRIFYYRFFDEETAKKISRTIMHCVDSINRECQTPSVERIL